MGEGDSITWCLVCEAGMDHGLKGQSGRSSLSFPTRVHTLQVLGEKQIPVVQGMGWGLVHDLTLCWQAFPLPSVCWQTD